MIKSVDIPGAGSGFTGDPSLPGRPGDDTEGAGDDASLTPAGGASSPLAPPTGESGDGAPTLGHDGSGGDLSGEGTGLGDASEELSSVEGVEADVGSGTLSDRAGGLARRLGRRFLGKGRTDTGVVSGSSIGQRIGAEIGSAHATATEAAGSSAGKWVVRAGIGIVAAAGVVTVGLKTGIWMGSKGGAAEVAGNIPTGSGGANRPRTGTGLATELISSDRPSSGGSGSAVVDAAPQPSGSGSGATSEAVAQAPPRTSSPAMELIDSDRPAGGGGGASEVAAQQAPVGLETDGQGNYTIRIGSHWDDPIKDQVGGQEVPFHSGTMDHRVAGFLMENGVDPAQVRANPEKIHQMAMRLYEENPVYNGQATDQFATGADQPFTIRPGSRFLEQAHTDFGVDIKPPGSEGAAVEPPVSGGGGGSQPPAETTPDGGGTTETPQDLPNGGDVVPEDDSTGAILAGGAAGALLGAGLVSTGGALRSRRRARRAAHGGGHGGGDGHGGGGAGDGHGGGGGDHAGGGGDTDPAAGLAAIEAAFQARLAPLNDRINQLRQLAQDRQARIDELEQENDEEDEEWWERNGQIDVAGQLGGNIEDLNDPTNTYRQNLIGEAVAAAMENPHSGVTNPGDLELEGEQWIDQVLGAGRPTGVVDVGGNPTDLDRRAQHLTDLYDGVRMTEADGTTAIDSPDVVDTPNQLVVPVGPDGRILPGFLRAFSDIMRQYRQYNHAAGGPANDQLLRMLGDTGEGMETEIPWRNWLVSMGARFVRGEETT